MEALIGDEWEIVSGNQEEAFGDGFLGAIAGGGLGVGIIAAGIIASGPVGWVVFGALAVGGAVAGYAAGDGKF